MSKRAKHKTSREAASLERVLQNARVPQELNRARNDALISAALEDPLRPASPEERREAEELCAQIDARAEPISCALQAAWDPNTIDEQRANQLLDSALGSRSSEDAAKPPRKASGQILYVTFGIGAGVAAAAAAIALVVTAPQPSAPDVSLARARSAAPLFEEPFSREGASERVDRIASARARELRSNRFAMWGLH